MSAFAKPRPVPPETPNPQSRLSLTTDFEFDVLVACCATESTSGRADRILQLLRLPIHWERWLSLVDHHRVVPQVYRALAGQQESLPEEAFLALQSRYQDNARKALWLTGELIRVVSHLESAGIRTLPYKGPILAQAVYGEVAQRQFGDLDILTLPADVLKAKATLLALGYSCEPELRPSEECAYIGSGCGYVFHSSAGRNLLDLQWRIVPRFYSIVFDVSDFFERAEEIVVGGSSMRTLRAEDLLLVLCVHAAKHVWFQLSWLCDIAELVNSGQLDWNAIQDDAKRLGIERMVRVNLLLANKLLGSTLPAEIQKRSREDTSATILADKILRVIERSQHYDTESISYFRLMVRLRERWRDRARFFWRLAVTPSVSEWSAVRLPKYLHPLYRLVRLWRLAKRLVKTQASTG